MDNEEQRIHELKVMLASHLELTTDVAVKMDKLDSDLWVKGSLYEIVTWAYDWRSEIEELG